MGSLKMLELEPTALGREWRYSEYQNKQGACVLKHLSLQICASSVFTLLKDKMLLQTKAVKAGEMNPYHNLEVGMSNYLKPIDEFCTKFFVGTEVSCNCLLLKCILSYTEMCEHNIVYICCMKAYQCFPFVYYAYLYLKCS